MTQPTRAAILALMLSLPAAGVAEEAAEFYQPEVLDVAGWTVRLDPALQKEEHRETKERALEALENHLQRVKYILPADRAAAMQKLPLWVELHNDSLGNMQYHPDRSWLIDHGHNPRLAKHVHIPRAAQLYDRHMWAKHPYVILHELAHAYHDQVLGFDDADVVQAFEQAKKEGIYEEVLLYTGKRVRHYALSNHKEYFAESSEAYLGVNDFYPFVRAELKEHDPRMFELMQKVWGKVE